MKAIEAAAARGEARTKALRERRERIATVVLGGIAAGDAQSSLFTPDGAARFAVALADALIYQLDKSK